MDIADVRKVTLCYTGASTDSYLIPASEVDRFVSAALRLHYRPGRNPHNGEEAAKVWRITSAKLEVRGPFWWTVPDLMKNGDPAGAHIIDGGTELELFVDREQVARWEAEEAECRAEAYRQHERDAAESESTSRALDVVERDYRK